METKQKTPIALAEEQIAKLWSSPSDIPTYSQIFDILESLKPKEREMFESAYGALADFYTQREADMVVKQMFDTNLTQE